MLDQQLSPDLDQVATALARKFRWRIQSSGATALDAICDRIFNRLSHIKSLPFARKNTVIFLQIQTPSE
jgi:hypothetical protein